MDGGVIAERRLLRSDNLQDLTGNDIDQLHRLGVTDIIDLRSAYEVHSEGPGPLVGRDGFTFHQHSFFIEQVDGPARTQEDEEIVGKALPWAGKFDTTIRVADGFASSYLSFLVDRPESVAAALRAVAHAEGAALVHCAAGKDRTGTTVALSLLLAGAQPAAVVADYAASSERMQQIVDRLAGTATYGDNMAGRPLSSHLTQPHTMEAFLEYAENEYGGIEPMLIATIGWTQHDTAQMRRALRQ